MFYAYNLPKTNSEELIVQLRIDQINPMRKAIGEAAERQLSRWRYAYGSRAKEAIRWEQLLEESLADLQALSDRAQMLGTDCDADGLALCLLDQMDKISSVRQPGAARRMPERSDIIGINA